MAAALTPTLALLALALMALMLVAKAAAPPATQGARASPAGPGGAAGAACHHVGLGSAGECRRARDCQQFLEQRQVNKDYKGEFCAPKLLCCPTAPSPSTVGGADDVPPAATCGVGAGGSAARGRPPQLRKAPCEMRAQDRLPAEALAAFANASVAERKCLEYLDMEYQSAEDYALILGSQTCDRECTATDSVPLVVGGQDAAEHEFPHMALLLNQDDPYCGGSLISPEFVLTAAHCYLANRAERTVAPSGVRLGAHTLQPGREQVEERVAVAARYRHPQYGQSQGQRADIMLVKLASAVLFSSRIRPACLHTGDDSDLEQGKQGTVVVSGWGSLNYDSGVGGGDRDKALSARLQKASLAVVRRADCARAWADASRLGGRARRVSEDHICALGRLKNGSHVDSCQGDSGGPLQVLASRPGARQAACSYRVVAVVSTGFGCGTDVPGLYTSVAQFAPWIQSVVWPCERGKA